MRRVLRPGRRVLLVERLAPPGARGHAAHGLTTGQAGGLVRDLAAAGFSEAQSHTRRVGRRTLVMIQATRDARR
jgi:hypothetical protein